MNLASTKQIDIIVIDPHPLFREGLKRVLEIDTNLRIVAEGELGDQLLPLYKQYNPQAILIEAKLDDFDVMESMQHLLCHYPSAKVIIFSAHDDPQVVNKAIQAGASGYLLKEMDATSIAAAIKTVVKGDFFLHPNLTSNFLAELYRLSTHQNNNPFIQSDIKRPYHLLTSQECVVLQLLSEGHSNKSLANLLNISEKTVKNHVSSVLKKMKLHDRTQAVVEALKKGWIELK